MRLMSVLIRPDGVAPWQYRRIVGYLDHACTEMVAAIGPHDPPDNLVQARTVVAEMDRAQV